MLLLNLGQAGLQETHKERRGVEGTGVELWVVLGPHKEGMVRALGNLHALPALIPPDNLQAGALNLRDQRRVHLVAVPVALHDAPVLLEEVEARIQRL